MQRFDENAFKSRVDAALRRVKTVLETNRNPQYPADVPHAYDDKYLLAESLTNNTLGAYLVCLENLGLNAKQLAQLKDWSKTRSVTLRLKAEEKCKFLRKVVREVQSDTKSVSNSTVFGKSEHYTVTKVTEYFWQFDANYQLVAFQGTDSDKAVVLQQRAGGIELKTSVETTPKPATVVRPSIDVNITWLLQNLEESTANFRGKFHIDRLAKSCHTPRRNEPIDGAFRFFTSFYSWAQSVSNYFNSTWIPVQADHGLDLSAITSEPPFVPVVPLFEKPAAAEDKIVLPAGYAVPFAAEQSRSIAERFKAVNTVFPANDKLVTQTEARLLVVLLHLRDVSQMWADGVEYIENMLWKQLVAAIGKEVGPVDFANYLRFHNRKLFKAEYAPRPFCYAIRRPDHYPEGTLSIEAQQDDGSLADPIATTVAWSPAVRPMKFSIDAATQVSFGGDRFLHGWVNHQFSGSTGSRLQLVARARQFSSYIVLVGSIASAELFEPKYGIIVQNKDELLLPLLLETIPTPKEFRDAIESLSPEQQRFAKAFRSMQLESTLFGVCVLQIKPQLEKLLRLPNDSLTKEIQLSQDLLDLFIQYQVPSDLLSYDGAENAPMAQKVETVQKYVKNMYDMINKSKQVQLDGARLEQQMRIADDDSRYVEEKTKEEVGFRRSAKLEKSSSRDKEKERDHSKKDSSSDSRRRAKQSSSSSATFGKLAPPAKLVAAAPPKPTSPPAATAPAGTASPQPTAQQPKQQTGAADNTSASAPSDDVIDYTKIPQQMEAQFDEFDEDSALRPTIIAPGNTWNKKFQKTLLSAAESTSLGTDEQGKERQKCFDLLDALTKSGALSVDFASLHVVIAATHCFDKTLMNTLVQDNVNPIEKVERSSLIVASTIHHCEPAALIAADQLQRVATYSPKLLASADDEEDKLPLVVATSSDVVKKS